MACVNIINNSLIMRFSNDDYGWAERRRECIEAKTNAIKINECVMFY